MHARSAVIAAVLSVAVLAPSICDARAVDHRRTKVVCAEGLVERAPAYRPIAPAYPGDHFTITRAKLAVVHHTNGTVERFAKGYLINRPAKSGPRFRYDGWISTRVLAGGASCP